MRARGGVEHHRIRERIAPQPRDLRERERLMTADVVEQRGGRARSRVVCVRAQAVRVARRARDVEALRADALARGVGQRARERRGELGIVGDQELARGHATQLLDQRGRQTARGPLERGGAQVARGRVEHRESDHGPRIQRRHGELGRRVDRVRIAREPRRHHLDDLAPHELPPRDRARVLDLLADRDAMAVLGEHGEVLVGGVYRHAAHRHRVGLVLVARRQRDVEQRRGDLRVAQEHLVEIAHPVEHDRIGMRRLDREVLAHHGRVERGLLAHPIRSRVRNKPRRSSTSSSSAYSLVASGSRCSESSRRPSTARAAS